MCHWIAQNGGGVRRWRPEAGTCGPDMTYSGAKSRSGPQMFLNKGQTEKIKQQLPVREACRGVGLFARAVGLGCPQKRLVLRISSRKTGRCPHQHPILRISGGKTGFRPHLGLILRIHLGKRQGVGQQLPVREACRGVGRSATAIDWCRKGGRVRPDKLYLLGRAQPCRLRGMTKGRGRRMTEK